MRRLLIRPGAIGDFILSLPALEFLRASYTELWCAEQNVPLAVFPDQSRSIISAGLDRVAILPDSDVLERLAAFDEIHSWYGTKRPEFRDAVSHLPFVFHDALPGASGMHATDFYCRQVGAPVTPPRIRIPPEPLRIQPELPGGFAVIHPFASNPAKRWPLSHFASLTALLTRIGVPVWWCAGPDEPLAVEPAARVVRISALDQLARWLTPARIYIGNDSGITHLAAALNLPTLALFGPTDPEVWAPRGPNVSVLIHHPIYSLPVQDVFLKARTLL